MGTRLTMSTTLVPDDRRTTLLLDLEEDRSLAITVRAGVALVVGAMVVAGFVLDLPTDSRQPGWSVAATTVAACLAYMVVHELTHGVALRLLTGVRPTFAVRLPYLVTGSPALLSRRVTLVVSLAPVVLWGAVLVALFAVVPEDLFLTTYVLLGLNFAGSAGDVLQAWVVARLPEGTLVRDDGTRTTAYLPVR